MKPPIPATDTAARSTAEVSLFERVLFFVLLAVLCVRPLISESFERVELHFLGGLGGTPPAATVWLDSLALTAAVAALARGWGRWRRGGWALLGVAFLAVTVGVSVVNAGDKRMALNAGFSLFIGVLCGAALVQLMRAPWMPRLLLAAVLATGCTVATKCLTQKWYEFEDTAEFYEENKQQMLTAAGVDPDDPRIINFERRLHSGEAFAFQAHPNLTAAMLAMWLLTAAGVLAGWLRGGDSEPRGERGAAIVLCAAVCLLLAIGLWFTGSIGAFVALAVGVVLLLILGTWRRTIATRTRLTTALLVAGYLTVIAAGIGVGVSRGTLPHPSLAFRWYYWTAAAEAFQDAPLTGIGRGNFADAYLLHKAAESTEEVRDPHNLWLSLLVELGPLGLAGGVLLIVGCLHSVLRRLDTVAPQTAKPPRISIVQMIVAAGGVMLLHALFSGQIMDAPTAVLWAVQVEAVWVLALVLAARLLDHLPNPAAAAGWLTAGLAAALGAGLVHGLIGFALLTPAGLGSFIALAACALALRPAASTTIAQPAPVVAALAGTVLVSAHLLLVTIPTMRSGLRLAQMDGARFDPARLEECRTVLALGCSALAADPLDTAGPRAAARLALGMALNPDSPSDGRLELLRQAEDFALTALWRNPRSSAAYTRLARIHEEIEYALLLDRPDEAVAALEKAVAYWQKAVTLYPTDPRNRISAGKAWFFWWEETDRPPAARTAARHFAEALRIDATRPPNEVVRLRPAELAVIHKHLRMLEDAGFGVPTASAPAPQPSP